MQEPCNTSFTQAIANEGNLLFLSSTIRLAGFTAKLPDPNIGITVFAPTNDAMWKLLTAMNLGMSHPPQTNAYHSDMFTESRMSLAFVQRSFPAPPLVLGLKCTSSFLNLQDHVFRLYHLVLA